MVILGIEFFFSFFKGHAMLWWSGMIPLLLVWVTSSVYACVLSYCLSFLPPLKKNFAIKSFFNFCVVAIYLLAPSNPGIGTGNHVSNYLPSRDANTCLQGSRDVISTCGTGKNCGTGSTAAVENLSCAHPLWSSWGFHLHFSTLCYSQTRVFSFSLSPEKSNTGSFLHTLSEAKTCMNLHPSPFWGAVSRCVTRAGILGVISI